MLPAAEAYGTGRDGMRRPGKEMISGGVKIPRKTLAPMGPPQNSQKSSLGCQELCLETLSQHRHSLSLGTVGVCPRTPASGLGEHPVPLPRSPQSPPSFLERGSWAVSQHIPPSSPEAVGAELRVLDQPSPGTIAGIGALSSRDIQG